MGTFKGTINRKGRTKGSANKTTALSRKLFNDILEQNINTIQDDIDTLQPLERLKVLLHLAEFCIPKLKAMELDVQGSDFKPIVINFTDDE
jgi:hypothetical protein